MSSDYVVPRKARHRVVTVEGREEIEVPARRNWFVIPFLSLWLTGWTIGGVAAMIQAARTHEAFLFVWLIGWAFGWVFAGLTLGWQLTGVEIVRVAGGDLELAYRLFGHERRRRYRGADIRHLASAARDGWFAYARGMELPLFRAARGGAVKFDYGADTIHFASGVDEAEGREIVAWVGRRLVGRVG